VPNKLQPWSWTWIPRNWSNRWKRRLKVQPQTRNRLKGDYFWTCINETPIMSWTLLGFPICDRFYKLSSLSISVLYSYLFLLIFLKATREVILPNIGKVSSNFFILQIVVNAVPLFNSLQFTSLRVFVESALNFPELRKINKYLKYENGTVITSISKQEVIFGNFFSEVG